MDINERIESDFFKRIQQQEELGGIDITKLSIGDQIEVQTKNSTYVLKIKDPVMSSVILTQPKMFMEPVEATILGSSWSGGALKLHWIGYDLNLEFTVNATHYITTTIQSAKVMGVDWNYTMEWEKLNGKDEKTGT